MKHRELTWSGSESSYVRCAALLAATLGLAGLIGCGAEGGDGEGRVPLSSAPDAAAAADVGGTGGAGGTDAGTEPGGVTATDVTFPTGATLGEAVWFDASEVKFVERARWTFSGTTTRTGLSVSHRFTRPGSADVEVELVLADGTVAHSSGTVDVSPLPGSARLAPVTVTVLDPDDEPVVGAVVSVDGAPDSLGDGGAATTDATGVARFEGVDLRRDLGVRAMAEGFVPGVGAVLAGSIDVGDGTHETVIRLLPAAPVAATIEADAVDGVVVGDDGAMLAFEQAAFIHADGSVVTTPVDVHITTLDVSDPAELAAFPGSPLAEDAAGESVYLLSGGMTSYTFTSEGAPVTWEPGTEATIRIPVSPGVEVAVGESVPLWSLDERTGTWVQEGEGRIVDDAAAPSGLALEGAVAHFTWWNCDIGEDWRPRKPVPVPDPELPPDEWPDDFDPTQFNGARMRVSAISEVRGFWSSGVTAFTVGSTQTLAAPARVGSIEAWGVVEAAGHLWEGPGLALRPGTEEWVFSLRPLDVTSMPTREVSVADGRPFVLDSGGAATFLIDAAPGLVVDLGFAGTDVTVLGIDPGLTELVESVYLAEQHGSLRVSIANETTDPIQGMAHVHEGMTVVREGTPMLVGDTTDLVGHVVVDLLAFGEGLSLGSGETSAAVPVRGESTLALVREAGASITLSVDEGVAAVDVRAVRAFEVPASGMLVTNEPVDVAESDGRPLVVRIEVVGCPVSLSAYAGRRWVELGTFDELPAGEWHTVFTPEASARQFVAARCALGSVGVVNVVSEPIDAGAGIGPGACADVVVGSWAEALDGTATAGRVVQLCTDQSPIDAGFLFGALPSGPVRVRGEDGASITFAAPFVPERLFELSFEDVEIVVEHDGPLATPMPTLVRFDGVTITAPASLLTEETQSLTVVDSTWTCTGSASACSTTHPQLDLTVTDAHLAWTPGSVVEADNGTATLERATFDGASLRVVRHTRAADHRLTDVAFRDCEAPCLEISKEAGDVISATLEAVDVTASSGNAAAVRLDGASVVVDRSSFAGADGPALDVGLRSLSATIRDSSFVAANDARASLRVTSEPRATVSMFGNTIVGGACAVDVADHARGPDAIDASVPYCDGTSSHEDDELGPSGP